MGKPWHRIMVRGTKSHYNGKGLFDPSSPCCYVDRALAKRLDPLYYVNPISGRITKCASGTIPKTKAAVLLVKIGKRLAAFNFSAKDNLSEKIIIGLDFLRQFDIKPDFKKKQLIIPDRYWQKPRIGGFRRVK